MPKRRKLLTPMKKKSSAVKTEAIITKEVSTPRGRLKGALLEVLEPTGYDSETSLEQTPIKRERNVKQAQSSDDEERTRHSLPRQSYVLKLFDRSVDLSQFEEDSPLYPICRAWMINQPKTNYNAIMGMKTDNNIDTTDKIELPGPEGPSVSRIPELLPEQQRRSKDNINLNYREVTLPRKDYLLQEHLTRWGGVRRAWLQQAARVEARYQATQEVLNTINTAL